MNWLGEVNGKADEVLKCMGDLTVALNRVYDQREQEHSRQLREWEQFVKLNGGATTSGGVLVVEFDNCPNGWEWLVQRLSISIGGASSGATSAVYVTTDPNDVSEPNLVDFASSFLGSSPSRQIADFQQPIWVTSNQFVVVSIASAVASQPVYIRLQGLRREV